jgi:hypothetical protein
MSRLNEENAEASAPEALRVDGPRSAELAPEADARATFEALPKEDPLYDEGEGLDSAEFEGDYKNLRALNESPLEPYGSVENPPECGPVVDEIHQKLRQQHLVILHSTDPAHLARVSSGLVARHFPPPNSSSVFYKQQSGLSSRTPPSEIGDILDWIKPGTLAVVFDQHYGDDSLLLTYDYKDTRGRVLRDRLESRGQTYVLVLTLTSRFERLIDHFQAYELEPLGLRLPPEPSQKPDAPPDSTLLDRISSEYGVSGILSLWCIAWLGDASVDSVITCIERMLEARYQGTEQAADVLEVWRSKWPALLASIGVDTSEDAAVKLRFPGEAWVAGVQKMFRGTHRMRHVEALRLLRESGVLMQAEVDLLQAFASLMARLAALEAQIGRDVLVQLIEEWLHSDSPELTLFVLVAVFCSLVRNENVKLASNALETLCHDGRADIAVAVLMRCPTAYASQEWHVRLYERVLPTLGKDVRPLLWSHLVRISAARDADLAESVRVANASLSASAFAEFVGRFVEESLLGPPDRRARLLGLLTSAAADSTSIGSRVCATIRSDAFLAHARQRTRWWTSDGTGQTLFDIWIVRTLAPLVPSMSRNRLLNLLGSVLNDNTPTRLSRRARTPSPVDRIVAMLLVECCSADTQPARGVDEATRSLVRLVVPDQERATAVYESLSTLSDRFLRSSRAAAVTTLRGDSAALDARAAIRSFFGEKSDIVSRLRKHLESTYFQGARRVD